MLEIIESAELTVTPPTLIPDNVVAFYTDAVEETKLVIKKAIATPNEKPN